MQDHHCATAKATRKRPTPASGTAWTRHLSRYQKKRDVPRALCLPPLASHTPHPGCAIGTAVAGCAMVAYAATGIGCACACAPGMPGVPALDAARLGLMYFWYI